MGGIFNSPPEGSGYPDIPVPDFKQAAQQSVEGAILSGWWDDLINKYWHSIWDGSLFSLNFLAGGLDEVFSVVTKFFTTMQGFDTPGYFDFIASLMGDLLGIEFNSDVMINAWKKGGDAFAMTVVGQQFLDKLSGEFSTALGSPTVVPSAAPAQTFLGYLASFAIRQGNITFWADLLPESVDFLRGIREYGELLASNLGLGRLARRALQPLAQILVATPLEWKLNAQYRPKLAPDVDMVKALLRGDIDRTQLNTWMSYLGYSDSNIELLIANNRRPWTARELIELQRLGQMDDTTAISLLQQQGIDQGTATLWWTVAQGETAQPLVRQFANLLIAQWRDGFITTADVQSQTATLPLTQMEKQWFSHLLGTRSEFGWRHLSEAQAERAYLGGIIDLSTIQQYWQRLGYSNASVQTLTLLLLERQSTGNRTAAGHVPHKALTEAQLEKAYKEQIIDLSQLQAGWVKLGYSPADVLVLKALVAGIPPTEGSTALPGVTTP